MLNPGGQSPQIQPLSKYNIWIYIGVFFFALISLGISLYLYWRPSTSSVNQKQQIKINPLRERTKGRTTGENLVKLQGDTQWTHFPFYPEGFLNYYQNIPGKMFLAGQINSIENNVLKISLAKGDNCQDIIDEDSINKDLAKLCGEAKFKITEDIVFRPAKWDLNVSKEHIKGSISDLQVGDIVGIVGSPEIIKNKDGKTDLVIGVQ